MKKSLIVSLGVIFSLVACSDYQAEYEDKYEALVSEPIEVLDSSAKETIVDARDNQVYEVVQIGTQKWLARNLNYNDGKGKCPSEKNSLCEKYGRLYNASSIIKAHKSDKANGDQEIYDSLRALCPEGWHVPFKSEWKVLKDYVASHGKKGEVGKNLKSTDGWFGADSMVVDSKDSIHFAVASGNDPYGFNALPAGICRGSVCDVHENAYFWGIADTVRESFATMLVGYVLSFENDDFVVDGNINYLNNPRVSVRCIEGDRREAYFDSTSLRNSKEILEDDASSSSEEVEPSEGSEKSTDGDEESSEESAVTSSSSVTASSDSVAKSSSSIAASSASIVVKGKYDCSVYNCVTTEYLNQTMLAAGEYGELLDTRDDQVYRTIKIGTQTWMAQNLNYSTIDSKCYDGSAANCKKYGQLYLQSEAKSVCPTGWHLPSEKEWNVLNDYVDGINGTDAVGTSLKALGVWDDISSVSKGTDLVGFSGLPSVYFGSVSACGGVKTHGLYWTADVNEYRCLLSDNDILYDYTDSYAATYGMSVRCLKGAAQTTPLSSSSSVAVPKSSSSVSSQTAKYDCSKYNCVTTEYLNQDMLAAGKYGEYLDERDTMVYRTIKIGSQVWMAQNLNHKMKVSYCLNDTASYCAKYGRLYEYDSASNACPSGWRLPTIADWQDLYDTVGSYKALWSASFYSGTDDFGFSGVPTSVLDGNYSSNGYVKADAGFWWSSTSYISSYNKTFELYKESVYFGYYGLKSRLAVRCIMK
jgi:uncharacterized protein (TIGR02145 family)